MISRVAFLPARIHIRYACSLYLGLIFLGYIVPALINRIVTIDIGNLDQIGLFGDGYAKYIWLWTVAIIAFFCGAGLPHGGVSFNIPTSGLTALRLFALFIGAVVILLKILLIPSGVYGAYAFDSGQMTGGIWSLSMSFSELCVYFFTASLAFGDKKAAWFFAFLIALNLLHGTRIFFVAAVSIFVFSSVARNGISLRKCLILLFGFLVLLLGAMGIFIVRSSVAIDWSDPVLVLQYALSPLIYESVFSQLGLIDVANGLRVNYLCTPLDFLRDTSGFIIPRFLNPDKDGSCIDYLAYLQPLGALNGVLGVYAYFQDFSYVFFLGFGLIGRTFFFFGRRNVYIFSLFLYFFGSGIFRLVRDGPILSLKFLSVALAGCLLLYVCEQLLTVYRRAKLNGEKFYAASGV